MYIKMIKSLGKHICYCGLLFACFGVVAFKLAKYTKCFFCLRLRVACMWIFVMWSTGCASAQSLEAIPTLNRIWTTNADFEISDLCHGLLFYGLGNTDLPTYPSGAAILKVLTDEEAAIKRFGRSPFVRTRNGLRYFVSDDPVFHTRVGEIHRDQCLATFATIKLPLDTPIFLKSGNYTISNLLSESIANFDFDQAELAWTSISYAEYMPPRKEWVNRFGKACSFSELVQYFLKLDLASQSCAGTHIIQALAKIEYADHRYSILELKTRKQLNAYLEYCFKQAIVRQNIDGFWNKDWCDLIKDPETGPFTPIQYRILVTGHLLEVFGSVDSRMQLPKSVSLHAAQWLKQSLKSDQVYRGAPMICPVTHSARMARQIFAVSDEVARTDSFFPAK